MPTSLAAFVAYPDWNLGYFVAWEKLGWPGTAAIEAVLLALLFGGRAEALAALARGRHSGWTLWSAIAGGVGGAGTVALVWDRYLAERDVAFDRFSALAGVYLIAPLVVLLVYNVRGGSLRPRPR